jgi:hypothetical protein
MSCFGGSEGGGGGRDVGCGGHNSAKVKTRADTLLGPLQFARCIGGGTDSASVNERQDDEVHKGAVTSGSQRAVHVTIRCI